MDSMTTASSREILAPPKLLRVGLQTSPHAVAFPYEADATDTGSIHVRYPFPLDPEDEGLMSAIGLGVAVYLGQLCLAEEIHVDFPVSDSMVDQMRPLAEMLYNVRRWKDHLPLVDPPSFASMTEKPPVPYDGKLEERRSVLLWSGGKDSTLSALLLKKNGYDVRPAHITVNAEVEDREMRAVRSLAQDIGLSPETIELSHPEFLSFSGRYALEWDRFPHCNRIPFGRDLLLALVAVPLALRRGAGNISMGHDNECRNAYVTDYQGKSFPRNDVESVEGAMVLERYIQSFLAPSLRLLPPIARLSEFRVLYEMFVNWPGLMAKTSFCFWPGRNCGRCAKCLRYYLAQRITERDVLEFEVNPLGRGNCPELDELMREWGEPGTLFQKQVWYCLSRLVERGALHPAEDRIQDLHVALKESSGLLDQWDRELMRVGDDPQVPAGFVAT